MFFLHTHTHTYKLFLTRSRSVINWITREREFSFWRIRIHCRRNIVVSQPAVGKRCKPIQHIVASKMQTKKQKKKIFKGIPLKAEEK